LARAFSLLCLDETAQLVFVEGPNLSDFGSSWQLALGRHCLDASGGEAEHFRGFESAYPCHVIAFMSLTTGSPPF
jgi:hypothetical protein